MKKFDLTWGESVVVRQRFVETFGSPIIIGSKELEAMGYTKHDGDPELIALTRWIIQRQIGKHYDYIFITNGATGGVTIALRAYNQNGYETVLTRTPPFFSIYPAMFQSAGMTHKTVPTTKEPHIRLIDSPSNPFGKTHTTPRPPWTPTVWDAVYQTNGYTMGNIISPHHDVLVGSYSKLTGLNGIRLGWIATNDPIIAERVKKLVEAEYCGLSKPSGDILLALLKGKEDRWDEFESMCRHWLDRNREEWSKLERYFGNEDVPINGMFYYAPMDEACKRLMEKAGVAWTSGASMHDTDEFGRINIGQDAKMIQAAVKSVLKADKIR